MFVLLFSIILLGIIVAVVSKLRQKHGEEQAPITIVETCSTCNGSNDKCEQDCMMEAAVKDIEYYDDEELDHFRGRPSDSYADNEVEQFSEVLYTMRQDEVAGWCRSLTLRGISLPDQLKDEVFMLAQG